MKNLFVLLFAIALLPGCSTAPKKDQAHLDPHPQEANLTQAEAMERSASVGNVKYQLAVEMDDTADSFKATETIEFDRRDSARDLFLDFRNGGKILRYSLNGKNITPVYAQHRILLPLAMTVSGTNRVEIEYRQNYSTNGRGLHRFVDPEDKRVYFYSQFEAYNAHYMFPCFDQPDLKATLRLTVTAPKAWEVISTMREASKVATGEKMVWTFPETPRLSTYLFSLHAGPYAKWESKSGTIPLRLFARQSFKKFVVAQDWFKPTQQGLRFFGEYFAYPYPFKKFDQVLAPEFNFGGMENVAAVTYSEFYVRRSASTVKDRERIAGVILHEMAHMWFGDLVTMRWWNGLWLNESFATYMSYLAQSRATEFKDGWISFSRNKAGTYESDQLVTTHPVEAKIPDTDSALTLIDHITYGKGASVLKQLAFFLGEDVFREGVRHYFKDYAYSNTTLADFIGSLEQASRQDLHMWSKAWLEEAGLDTVEADFGCDQGKVSRFALKLTGPNGMASSRPHRTLVAFYHEKGGKIVPMRQQSVLYKGPRTEVPGLVGADCPLMVYPNELDYDYVKVRLDPRSLAAAKESLGKIGPSFTRVMLWPNLYAMVRGVELTPQEFIRIVVQNLPNENDLTITQAIHRLASNIIYYLPKATDDQKQARAKLVAELEDVLWKKIEGTKNVDLQKMSLGAFVGIVESQRGRDRLLGLLEGTIQFKGMVIDADRRWDMVIKLASLGDERVEPIFAKMRELDKTARGVSSAFAAEAAKPSLDVKSAWLEKISGSNSMSFEQKRTVLANLLPQQQESLRASLADKYYASLTAYARSMDMNLLDTYAATLLPATCTPSSAAKLESFVRESSSNLPPTVVKTLRIGAQEDARCVTIREHAK